MNEDLEHTLRDSLDRHAAGARASGGSVDDVYRRADRRRARRRSIAVVGSIAVVVAGIVGFASLGGGSDPAPDLAEASAPASSDQAAVTSPDVNAYACTNYLGSKNDPAYGQREIYGDCVPVTVDGPLTATNVAPTQCIVPTTFPATTTTTTPDAGTGTGAGVANVTVGAVACLDTAGGPPGGCVVSITPTTSNSSTPPYEPGVLVGCSNFPTVFEQQCFASATPAIPPTAPTTSVDVAIGTLPGPGTAAAGAVVCESSSSQASTTTTTTTTP